MINQIYFNNLLIQIHLILIALIEIIFPFVYKKKNSC